MLTPYVVVEDSWLMLKFACKEGKYASHEKNPWLVVTYIKEMAGHRAPPEMGELIFFCQHDSKYPNRLFRIGGIIAAVHQVRCIVVNLPEDVMVVMGECPKIPFSVRVIVFGECVEAFYFLPDG